MINNDGYEKNKKKLVRINEKLVNVSGQQLLSTSFYSPFTATVHCLNKTARSQFPRIKKMKEQFLRKYDLFIVTDACQKAAICEQNRALKFYLRIDRLSAIIKCEA